MKSIYLLVVMLVVAQACALQEEGDPSVSALLQGDDCTPIAGEYIVVASDNQQSAGTRFSNRRALESHLLGQGAAIKHAFSHAINGYVIKLPANLEQDETKRAHALGSIEQHPLAPTLQPNMRCRHDWQSELEPEQTQAPAQENAPWNLARIDQVEWDPEHPDTTYDFPESNAGAGVTAYVLDSGIYRAHNEFCSRSNVKCKNNNTRVVRGYSAVGANPFRDNVGHGTHVAATLGGLKYGVAKDVSFVSVQLSNSDWLTLEEVLKGIDFVARDYAEHGGLAVANMSFGGPRRFQVVNIATENLISQGIVVAAAAGNWYMNACQQTPANVPGALTVAASTIVDSAADFSNWGGCVDIFAPGQDIVSAGTRSERAKRTASGTSMSTPHVAGVAALYLQAASLGRYSVRPEDVAAQLVCRALQNRLSGVRKHGSHATANRSLYMGDITELRPDPGC
jgi:subtilisin family serine protease